MKQNKYKRIAHKMGFYKNFENRYCKTPPERTGLQGVAMHLLDEIEKINDNIENKDILSKYDAMQKFFNAMKDYYK